MDANAILTNYQHVRERIDRAAQSVGRDPRSIKLVVVTKGHSAAAVHSAIAAGLRVFGENYAEEGLEKMRSCSEATGLEWHMIGHVQSRKARMVAEHYDWVHSLDSLKLALRLDRFAGEFGRQLPVMLECNVSGEESKFGWPAWNEDAWENLLVEFSQILELPNLDVRGLMTMAPFLPDPEQTRPYMRRLKNLQSFLASSFSQASWQELSMGMSDDFEVAIQEGATIVRVGTAIMGPRPEPKNQ